MPIKDEELRKIIKILVDKDKDKKARKKARKKRRRATGGASAGSGMTTTAQMDPTQGIGGRPGSLMGGFGGVNYWGGGGGGGGALAPTRQEIQNLIQSNLTIPPAPLAIGQPPLALPPSLASENIFDIPDRNILTQEQEAVLEPAKWTMDEIEADTYGNFAGGTGSDAFLDPGAVPVAAAYGGDDLTAGDLTENYIPGEYNAGGFISEGEDISPVKGRNFATDLPAIPEEVDTTPNKRKKRTPEEVLADEQSKAVKALLKLQKKDDALKAKQAKIEAKKAGRISPAEPTTSIYKRGKSIPSESESEF